MWDYNYTTELYHYGVAGMKWGVRHDTSASTGNSPRNKKSKSTVKETAKKITKKVSKNIQENRKARHKRIDKYTKIVGPTGYAIGKTVKYKMKRNSRALTANIINSAANAYIASGQGKYATQRGVDFVRNAAITGLSVGQYVDKYKWGRDVGYAYLSRYINS